MTYNKDLFRWQIYHSKTNKLVKTMDYFLMCGEYILWIPDKDYSFYYYSYDRDDARKLFMVNLKTSKTILIKTIFSSSTDYLLEKNDYF